MPRSRGRPPHPDTLTPAEWAVLDLVRHGLRRSQIADRRGTSVDAVKYHLANLSSKLGVATRELQQWPGYPVSSPIHRSAEDTMTTDLHLGPLGQVSLDIGDVKRAERFYGEVLGLPHVFTFGDLAFFDMAGTRLYLHRKSADDWKPGSILYFRVADIRAAHAELTARDVHFTGAPHLIYTDDETGDEEWMAFFEDGEGNTLAIMSRVPASRPG